MTDQRSQPLLQLQPEKYLAALNRISRCRNSAFSCLFSVFREAQNPPAHPSLIAIEWEIIHENINEIDCSPRPWQCVRTHSALGERTQ
jgi:hypothetical protein